LGCGGNSDTLTDPRDGQEYRTVKIGKQTWMAENLNYEPQSYYDCDTSVRNSRDRCYYGRLYMWEAAMAVCPPGWHLPSRQEWDDLCKAVGGKREIREERVFFIHSDAIVWRLAGKKLKTKSGWKPYDRLEPDKYCGWDISEDCRGNGNGTDKYGFSALPGGERSLGEFPRPDCNINGVGYAGGWWTATEIDAGNAYNRVIESGYGYVYEDNARTTGGNMCHKRIGRSVRCVMGAPVAYSITLNATTGGTVSGHPIHAGYAIGRNITIEALPDSGYTFAGWTGGQVENAASEITAVIVDSNVAITANFQKFVKPRVVHGALSDPRDRKAYKTVTIGNTTWMAENLNYRPRSGESWCYENSNSHCKKYGRLYDWNTAKTVCPSGWHLPSSQEWDSLGRAVGGKRRIPDLYGEIGWFGAGTGKMLKSARGWGMGIYNGNGTDEYGFSALPGGCYLGAGAFRSVGLVGNWWTATERYRDYYHDRSMSYSRKISYETGDMREEIDVESYGYSVRCVRDATPNPAKDSSHDNR
jgi:uncharacterized protein (TIGR02145 family)/uncharacterized repeat protein (TIGR02543 family)